MILRLNQFAVPHICRTLKGMAFPLFWYLVSTMDEENKAPNNKEVIMKDLSIKNEGTYFSSLKKLTYIKLIENHKDYIQVNPDITKKLESVKQ